MKFSFSKFNTGYPFSLYSEKLCSFFQSEKRSLVNGSLKGKLGVPGSLIKTHAAKFLYWEKWDTTFFI